MQEEYYMKSTSHKRIGIFGGSFDPIHNGHVAVAKHVIKALDLDLLYIMVANLSPLKASSNETFAHRLAMAQHAFAGEDKAVVSDLESRRTPPSYTIDTIREISVMHPGAEIFLIIGEDVALELHKWDNYQHLFASSTIVVTERGGYDKNQMTTLATKIGPENTQKLIDNWLNFDFKTLSSTELRQILASGKPTVDLLPDKVATYIHNNNLYKS